MQTGFISGKHTQEEERKEGKATKQAGQLLQFKGKCGNICVRTAVPRENNRKAQFCAYESLGDSKI